MRINDVTFLVLAFVLGTLLGVIATLSVYSSISNKLGEGERQEAEEALKKAQDERDEALSRIDTYLEAEQRKGFEAEQPGGGEAPSRRAEAAPPKRADVAAAPRTDAASTPPPETLPAPREELTDATKSATSLGFGPPRQNGNK